MQIECKGRNVPVTEDLREHVRKRFAKIERQVKGGVLEVHLSEEANPRIPERFVVEITLHMKGCTLRAHDSARDLRHAINLCEEELGRQVKRRKEVRRHRREAHAMGGLGQRLGQLT
ncbi:ribosome-associated translation inhibitor RaiA [Conexibacter sp. W3-3-2]|uniref:Ribosome-associated translation inhibitor RaiA n=1 Tax=Paraconexibacter algicola TaxID=2133960 RepID=A0A2T4UMU2_9ACTN|nr:MULTISPECIES: ribosome-associated translation inhibitor RaiA [Solirubrobacterales]MTD44117.1 ribosome-associated translation inhibitor RaiA [Conexibacter sp. W3-3-2]PTL60552.1 ribosome-associated translation inhibitor RaiA [Paraconexibacter algicola]